MYPRLRTSALEGTKYALKPVNRVKHSQSALDDHTHSARRMDDEEQYKNFWAQNLLISSSWWMACD